MTAMTKAERKECAANQQGFRDRLSALGDNLDKANADVRALEDDMAAGIDGARAAALNRADDVRAIDMEISAVERLLRAEIDREIADRPFLEAERAAEQKARREAACVEIHAQAKRCDEAAQSLAAQLKMFTAALEPAVAAGVDPHVQHQMLMQYVMQPMLCSAGFSDLKPEWRASPHQSLEQAARSLVRA